MPSALANSVTHQAADANSSTHAAVPLQFALRLAHPTGQRRDDVYKMAETDMRDGMLFVR